MARHDPKVIPDGAGNFLGGGDSRRNPALLADNQFSFGVNISCRGGYADQRPPFHQRALTFADTESRTWFEGRVVQVVGQYRDHLAVMVGGRLFLIAVTDSAYLVSDITPRIRVATTADFVTPPMNGSVSVPVVTTSAFQIDIPVFVNGALYVTTSKAGGSVTLQNYGGSPGVLVASGTVIEALDPNMVNARHGWLLQAEQYLIAQDGKSAAIIYDGVTRRAGPKEVPSGTVMAFGNGRIWVARNGRQFVAGDINYGPTRVIDFTENTYIAEGGAFAVPADAGEITSMVFMPVLNTALGQGPLQVLTENSIYSVDLPVTREDWKNLADPVQRVGMRGFGAVNDDAVALINGDVFYRSRDGVRSYAMAVREFGTWGNVPISAELGRVIDLDPDGLIDLASATVFDNRFLFTTGLQSDGVSAYGQALGVMDFDPISYMGHKNPPIWDQFWTGLHVRKLYTGKFAGRERCFAIARAEDGTNQLWEIAKSGQFDSDQCRIKSVMETRSHYFNSLFEMNRLEAAEFWFDKLAGDVDFTVYYRQDQSPCWRRWADWSECQSAKDCIEGACWEPTVKHPGYRTRKSLGRPEPANDVSDNKPTDLGYEFQLRIEWTGRARLRQYLVRARSVEETVSGNLVH